MVWVLKILAICPNPLDITALYRVTGPLGALHRSGKLEVAYNDKLDYLQMINTDIVLIQRPSDNRFKEYCTFVKNWGKPLWLDFDDDLLEVPEDNPAAAHYKQDTTKDIVKACLKMCDILTVSTQAIADSYQKWAPNTFMVPNALDLDTLPKRDINWNKRSTVIAWRGGSTHEKDVWTVRDQLLTVAKDNPIWKFVFMGYDFNWLKWVMKADQYVYIPKADPAAYMKNLLKVSAPIHIVPLEDNLFNRAKSNIAMLEATWAGSAVIAPEMPEWDSCLSYNSKSFAGKVQELIDQPGDVKVLHDATWDIIQQKYVLSKVNKQRLKLIYDMAGNKSR